MEEEGESDGGTRRGGKVGTAKHTNRRPSLPLGQGSWVLPAPKHEQNPSPSKISSEAMARIMCPSSWAPPEIPLLDRHPITALGSG